MRWETAAPTVSYFEPGSKPAPGIEVLTTIHNRRSVALANRDRIAADFHCKIAGTFDANRFEFQVLVAKVCELLQKSFNSGFALNHVVVGCHEATVRGVQGGAGVIVSSIEGGAEILVDVPDTGFHIHKRSWWRRTAIRAVRHRTSSWGKATYSAPFRVYRRA